MKGNFININYKENKKNKNIYFICPYLSLYFQTIKQLTGELDLLNLYREFKPDEGQFPDNYQFIAK